MMTLSLSLSSSRSSESTVAAFAHSNLANFFSHLRENSSSRKRTRRREKENRVPRGIFPAPLENHRSPSVKGG